MKILHKITGEVLLEIDTLRGAYLGGAYLRGANLGDADLSGANLGDANLRDVDLRGADLSGANLEGANLHSAYLRDANLNGVDLSGVDLSGANLRKADLYSASGILSFSAGRHIGYATSAGIQLGCEHHSINHWVENYKEIGKKNNYSPDEIKDYGAWINIVKRRMTNG